MSAAWIAEETATAKFEDKRLNDRFAAILTAFGDRPNASIPAALNGRSELEACYRFFDNDNVTPERILQCHYDATRKRCESQKVVLCAQDTTELDFTRPKQQVVGAGPLNVPSRRGAYLHLNEAFTENGTPLGAIDSKMWTREDVDEAQPKPTAKEKRKERKALPMEEKESYRWLEGVRATQELAKQCPETLCVSLGDSESDIYELFAEERTAENFHFIIRACHDRVVTDESGNGHVPTQNPLARRKTSCGIPTNESAMENQSA